MSNPDRKRIPLPTDLTPNTFKCFCIAVPDDPDHIAAFWGALQVLANARTWGKPLTEDSLTISQYWADVLLENEVTFMADFGCGCCPDAITRYTQDGIREISFDNGLTWEADTGDPRMNGSILPPPPWLLAPGGHECEGAVTGRINIENAVAEILTTGVDVGFSGLVGIVIAVICALSAGVACAVAGIVGALVTVIVQVGTTVLEAAMTEAVYDTLECILFCNIEPDATFTEAGWESVKSDITEQLSADAEFVLWNMVNALGPAGLTNACRASISVIADCDDCVCDPCDNAFAFVGTLVDHPSEFVWEFASADDGFGQQAILVRFGDGTLTDCCCLAGVEMIGFAPFESHRLCGEAGDTGGNPGGADIWQYRRNTGVGGAGFGMILTLEACPEA